MHISARLNSTRLPTSILGTNFYQYSSVQFGQLHWVSNSLVLPAMVAYHSLLAGRTRLMSRTAILALGFSFCVAFIILLIGLTPGHGLPSIVNMGGGNKSKDKKKSGPPPPKIPVCAERMNREGASDYYKKASAKYATLRDDKFTIAMQTYHRPKELNETLMTLVNSVEIPSLHEVVVVWNDQESTPPPNFVSDQGIPVRYRHSQKNSLNEKLRPDPAYETQAILLSDDDVFYHPDDLEFAFQVWRKFGRDRLVGGLARCAWVDDNGDWRYDSCNAKKDVYSMIITNLAFAHIKFLDYYTNADDPITKLIRTHVDEHMNCEDIGMNYIASSLTRMGPLLVRGHQEYFNFVPSEGISKKKGHGLARNRCLNDFSDYFGCNPLVNETARIERGVVVRRV